jgi:phosphoribosyl-AMP cyclohydrolase
MILYNVMEIASDADSGTDGSSIGMYYSENEANDVCAILNMYDKANSYIHKWRNTLSDTLLQMARERFKANHKVLGVSYQDEEALKKVVKTEVDYIFSGLGAYHYSYNYYVSPVEFEEAHIDTSGYYL